MDDSPNSLKPPKPGGKGASKKPMMIGLAIFLTLILALMYSLTDTGKKKAQEEEKKPQVADTPLARGQGEGLALPPPPKTAVVMPDEDKEKPRKNLVVNIGQPNGGDANEKRRQQMLLTALSSPMVAKTGKSGQPSGQGESGSQNTTTTNSITTSTGDQTKTSYDPAANIDKENFFKRADTNEGGWLSRYTREPGRELEIKTGTVIPAVMLTGINSDLPGIMVAQVSQNVNDTATGEQLLIPQGAKLYGVYDSRVIYGQERVLVAWNRIIFRDGSSVTLGSMPGADMAGYSGFNDKVNNHYLRIFGSAFLMSMISGTTSYAVDSMSNQNSNNGSQTTTYQNAMTSALAAQMGQASIALLQKNLSISPTLEIRPGYQFNVVVTKDVAFTEPYSDQYIQQEQNTEDDSHATNGTVRP